MLTQPCFFDFRYRIYDEDVVSDASGESNPLGQPNGMGHNPEAMNHMNGPTSGHSPPHKNANSKPGKNSSPR